MKSLKTGKKQQMISLKNENYEEIRDLSEKDLQ